MTRSPLVVYLAVALAATATVSGNATADEMSDQAERGKRIFVEGESASGAPITAVVAKGATPIPASILPCAGCHGDDGEGRPEGGIEPPPVRWSYLTTPNGHEHAYGRSHPAFDAESVAAAITRGIDPAGNALDTTMPRYRMNADDMADLVAYLRHVEQDLDDGLTPNTIRVGTLLPITGPNASLGRAMQNVLEAVFADLNARGGIHGRRIELVVAEYEDELVESVWQARELIEHKGVFALVGNYAVGIEPGLAALAEEFEIAAVGPLTRVPRASNNGERHSFYLTGGLTEQAAVLARYTVTDRDKDEPKLAIVHPEGGVYDEAVAAVLAQLDIHLAQLDIHSEDSAGHLSGAQLDIHSAQLDIHSEDSAGHPSGGAQLDIHTAPLAGAQQDIHPGPLAERIVYTAPNFDPAAAAESIATAGADHVLFLAPAAELVRLGAALTARGLSPDLLLPGVFAGNDMFGLDASFGGRLLVGYPSTPADHSPEGIQEFEALHHQHEFGYEHSTAQISAFVAAKVLAEGLKRAGRDLSREKLLAALEGLSEFRTGLMPPISYGRRYRIGAYGGYVLSVDRNAKKFSAASEWISLRN